jgi:hypothetical protein
MSQSHCQQRQAENLALRYFEEHRWSVEEIKLHERNKFFTNSSHLPFTIKCFSLSPFFQSNKSIKTIANTTSEMMREKEEKLRKRLVVLMMMT